MKLRPVVPGVNDTAEGDRHVCEACGRSFESEEALECHVREVGLVD